ncbi:thioredoxin fold domain-containing protein [Acidithiobacillus caldus]|nr:thioredoxin fold domain-containing protein [Acidithiobacillus caldus]
MRYWTAGLAGLVTFALGMWFVNSPETAHADTTSTAVASYTPLVKKLSDGRAAVLSTFAGPDGMTGIVVGPVHGVGPKTIAWGIDGKSGPMLIPGPVLDAQGQNLSMQAAEQHGLMPKPMAAGDLAKAMLSAPGFTVGTKGPLFTLFLDPNCIFCHDFWTKAYPLAEAGKIRFKVVPVGFLKPSSLPKAVTILQGKNPVAAWAQNEASFDVHTEEGGAKPAKTLDPKVLAEVKANTELLAKTGEVATPTIVACLNGDKVPQVFHGMAPGMLAELAKGVSFEENGTCS